MLTSEPASRRKPRLPSFQARTSSIRSPEPLVGDVVAEAVAGRVVGDRQVGVAALARRRRHLLERVAAVGEGRVAVQVAADVVDRDQLRQLALRAPRAARPVPRAAPARCRRSRGARRPPPRSRRGVTSPDSISVIPCSETERPRATASSRSATLCACEPVKCWSRLPKASGATIRRSTEMPLWVCARTPLRPADAGGGDQRVRGEVLGELAGLGRGRDQVDVLAGLGPAPDRARRPRRGRPPGARAAPSASSSATGSTLESSSRPTPSLGIVEPLERREHVLLDLRPEALHARGSAVPRRPPSGPPAS